MKITLCIDKQNRGSPSEELREYIIDIGCPLRSIDDVFDELKISTDDNNILVGQITRRCYVDKYGVLKKLEQEKIQELDIPKIELFEGTNYVYIKEFTNLNMKLEYLTNAEMNKYFATRMEMNSSIKQTADSINLEVSKKVGEDEIISKINMSPEEIQILANKLGLTANYVIDIIAGSEINLTSKNISITSDNFSVDKNGNMVANNGTFKGVINNSTFNGGKIVLNDPVSGSNFQIADPTNPNNYLYARANGLFFQNNGSRLFSIETINSSSFPISCQMFLSGKNGSTELTDTYIKTSDVIVNGVSIPTFSRISKFSLILNQTPNYLEITSDSSAAFGVDIWQSDKRLKDNIQDSQYKALDKVMKIKHRSFDYKKGKHVNLGYVADELQEIDSDFVIEVGEEKMKQPLPKALIPLLSKAIQEQQEIIEKLESRVDELEKKVNTNE